jgi:guanylate kinase
LQRLQDRGRDSAEEISRRFRAAKREIHMAKGSGAFDNWVINDECGPRREREICEIVQKRPQ